MHRLTERLGKLDRRRKPKRCYCMSLPSRDNCATACLESIRRDVVKWVITYRINGLLNGMNLHIRGARGKPCNIVTAYQAFSVTTGIALIYVFRYRANQWKFRKHTFLNKYLFRACSELKEPSRYIWQC